MAEDTPDTPPAGGAGGKTVKTPFGHMNKQTVTIGIFAVGGIVLFALWRQRSAANAATTAATTATDAALTPATDFTPAPTGDATVNSDTSTQPSTNAEWTQQAISYLSSIGFDPTAIAAALGLYLGRQPLSADQQTIVSEARAAIGDPPVGGPYPVVTGLPATGSPAPATGQTFAYTVRAKGQNVSNLIHTVYGTPYTDTTEYALLSSQILALNPNRATWGASIPVNTVVTMPGSGPHHIN